MIDILFSLIGGKGALVGILTVLVGIGAFFLRSGGKRAERDKQIRERFEAMTEAEKIEQAVAGNTPEQNRAELKKWSKRK